MCCVQVLKDSPLSYLYAKAVASDQLALLRTKSWNKVKQLASSGKSLKSRT